MCMYIHVCTCMHMYAHVCTCVYMYAHVCTCVVFCLIDSLNQNVCCELTWATRERTRPDIWCMRVCEECFSTFWNGWPDWATFRLLGNCFLWIFFENEIILPTYWVSYFHGKNCKLNLSIKSSATFFPQTHLVTLILEHFQRSRSNCILLQPCTFFRKTCFLRFLRTPRIYFTDLNKKLNHALNIAEVNSTTGA
jgi:hypothetical protein